jgi:hypothetical protein
MQVELQAALILTLEEKNELPVPVVLYRYQLIRRLLQPQYLKVKHFSCRQMNPVYPVPRSLV